MKGFVFSAARVAALVTSFGFASAQPAPPRLEEAAGAPAGEPRFVEPALVFQCVAWGNDSLNNLYYYPDGNSDDENATGTSLLVSSGSTSPRYAFYGSPSAPRSLQVFHRPQTTFGPDGDILSDDNGSEQTLVCSVAFPPGSSHFLLMFMPGADGKIIQAYPAPFDEQAVPRGQFVFLSRAGKSYGVKFGEATLRLAPGQRQTVPAQPDANGDLFLRLYDLSATPPREVFSKFFIHVPQARGFLWVSPGEHRPNIQQVIDFGEDAETPPLGRIPVKKPKRPEAPGAAPNLLPPTTPNTPPAIPRAGN
mgnify:CR=1 FL=1